MTDNIHPNVPTDFIQTPAEPTIDPTAFVHPMGLVIGQVLLGRKVFVGPFASIRGDEGVPIYIGDESNVQDQVVLHALETSRNGKPIEENLRRVNGRNYAIYIGQRVSLAHQCQIHGPAVVGDDTFVGMQALLFKTTVGQNCFIGPAAKIIGVDIPDQTAVPTGAIITHPDQLNTLETITPNHPSFGFNQKVVHVNTQLATSYQNK